MSQAASSSAPTLWATATKEWVVQPKPKPGRKPKKEVAAPPAQSSEGDNKERRVQNRAAQRAFRERKQSQLAELQAKVQKYEQGEIERTVALQTIAQKLKAENNALRDENARLLQKIQEIQSAPSSDAAIASGSTRKRARDNTSTPDYPEGNLHSKKTKIAPLVQRSVSPMLSSVSSPDTSETGQSSFDTPSPAISVVPDERSWQPIDCGLCSNNTPCACRELGLKDPPLEFRKDAFIVSASFSFSEESSSPSSILDNPPLFQPAVPLRRRPGRSGVNKVFPVTPSAELKGKKSCSGDPSNCPACADDSFGKAFCTALSEKTRCESCPQNCGNLTSTVSALGHNVPCKTSPRGNSAIPTSSERTADTVPTNDAWHQLKSHPNATFADLEMLADVVARRSRCTGPTVRPSPNDESVGTSTQTETLSAEKPLLAPKEVLLQCNKPPICTVDAAGVWEALRLLDSKFSRTWE